MRRSYPAKFIDEVMETVQYADLDCEKDVEVLLQRIERLKEKHRAVIPSETPEDRESDGTQAAPRMPGRWRKAERRFWDDVNYDWVIAYESAVSSLVRSSIDENEEVTGYRARFLPEGLHGSVESVHQWIDRLVEEYGGSGPEPGPLSRRLFLFVEGKLVNGFPPERMIVLPKRDCPALLELKKLSSKFAVELRLLESEVSLAICSHLMPSIRSFRAHVQDADHACLTRVVLELDPTLTPKQVAAIFGRERARFSASKKQPTEKHLRLLQHCLRSPDPQRPASMSEIMEAMRRKQAGLSDADSKPPLRIPKLKWLFEEWNQRYSPHESEEALRWSYHPRGTYVVLSEEERSAYREEVLRLNPQVRDPYIPYAKLNSDDQFEERERKLYDVSFANFRRDFAQIRKRLWDPYPLLKENSASQYDDDEDDND